MTVRIGDIAFDCDDVLNLAAFWSAVLERPLDDGSSALFASIGGTDGERREPAWYFTKVPEAKRAKHQVPGANHSWIVMADPEGNEFCIAARSFTGWG